MHHRNVTPYALVREARFWGSRPALWTGFAGGVLVDAALIKGLSLDLNVGWLPIALVLAFAATVLSAVLISWKAAPWVGVIAGAAVVLGLAATNLLAVLAGAFLLAVMTLSAGTAWWMWDRLLRPLSSAAAITRNDEHSDHNDGMASWMDVGEHNARVRADAPAIRATLEGRDLAKVPATEYASVGGTVGAAFGPYSWTQTVLTSLKLWSMITGGPQNGKTQMLACRILDHPGSALVTSTRVDLLKQTGMVREAKGRIEVFNPLGLDDITSTVRWSVLVGCTDYDTAVRRAGELIADGSGEASSWHDKGRLHLPPLLHCAALAGKNLRKVVDWVEHIADARVQRELRLIVKRYTGEEGDDGDVGLLGALDDYFQINSKTRDGIQMAILSGLKWVKSERAALVGDAPLDDPDFVDIADLIRSGSSTLYLVCPRDHSGITPLTSALTSEVAFQVIKVADGGRLDPPFLMALDEAFLTCPGVDLAKWSSDMGGAGCPGVITLQSAAQLDLGWGHGAAGVITGNMGVLTVFGGTKDEKDLRLLSTLTGSRMKKFDEDDDRPVGTMNEAAISQLREHQAVLFVNGLRPIFVATQKAYERADVRAAVLCTGCGGSERSHIAPGANADHRYAPGWEPRKGDRHEKADEVAA
jgi:type IV secretion system protein VirD4